MNMRLAARDPAGETVTVKRAKDTPTLFAAQPILFMNDD
jgi:hypothetical protein